jgi:hypothetical protein
MDKEELVFSHIPVSGKSQSLRLGEERGQREGQRTVKKGRGSPGAAFKGFMVEIHRKYNKFSLWCENPTLISREVT